MYICIYIYIYMYLEEKREGNFFPVPGFYLVAEKDVNPHSFFLLLLLNTMSSSRTVSVNEMVLLNSMSTVLASKGDFAIPETASSV